MDKQCIWVFGNAVQDITVDVDMERLSHEPGNKQGEMMRLSERGVEINPKLCLIAQMGLQNFSIRMELAEAPEEVNNENWPIFQGGRKYTLQNKIDDNEIDDLENKPSAVDDNLHLPCESLSWGGGGVNVATFLRALTPDEKGLPIKYSDIAMSRTLSDLASQFKDIIDALGGRIDRLDGTDQIAKLASQYSPECSLEVYLASLHVKSVLYRPKEPEFRRNLVFSRFRSVSHKIDNKIIFRGGSNLALDDDDKGGISKLLASHEHDVGAIVLNSIKDDMLFKGAYSLYQSIYRKGEGVVAILAMTKPMKKFTRWMLQKENCDSEGRLPPFILVFNQVEAYEFANELGGKFEIPKDGDELPDIREFAELAIFLRSKFNSQHPPRIYITLGPNGSLGVENSGHVIYVSRFSKTGATIYDTNACGDAYCAAIALLEWAKHQGLENIANVNFPRELAPNAHEMEYFMAVATAAAYCKATNRRGRVYAADVKDLLQHNHLASQILPSIYELEEEQARELPECVDENFRLREPSQARFPGVTEALSDLLG